MKVLVTIERWESFGIGETDFSGRGYGRHEQTLPVRKAIWNQRGIGVKGENYKTTVAARHSAHEPRDPCSSWAARMRSLRREPTRIRFD